MVYILERELNFGYFIRLIQVSLNTGIEMEIFLMQHANLATTEVSLSKT